MTLRIDQLRLDFQPEENLDLEKIAEYVLQINDGKATAPVVVRFDGETYWLQDGFHRVKALRTIGLTEVEAEVLPGTYEDMEAEWREFLRAHLRDLDARARSLKKPATKE
jgi:ParB-like chromosome segregation protein Spo0J